MARQIIEFGNTAGYAQHKLTNPNLNKIQLMYYDMGYLYKKYGTLHINKKKNTYFIEDSHIIPIDNENKCCLNYFSKKCIDHADGIYDIWLRNCKNVTCVTVYIESIGKVYEYIRNDSSDVTDIQIPLLYHCENNTHVSHVFFENFWGNHWETSFIPLVSMYNDGIIIEVNKDASADVVLSTVYINHRCSLREVLTSAFVTFNINGKRFHVRNGKCKNDDRIDNKTNENSEKSCWLSSWLTSLFTKKKVQ